MKPEIEIIKIGDQVYKNYMLYGIIDNIDYYHDTMYYLAQDIDNIHAQVEDKDITLQEGIEQMKILLINMKHYAKIHKLMAKKL